MEATFQAWAEPFAPLRVPFIFGFGPTLMFNTATDEQLGTGEDRVGPKGLVFSLSEKWILGTVAQQWWSYSGDSTLDVRTSFGKVSVGRSDVSLTDLQPVIRYRPSPTTNIGIAPNVRYNGETDQLSLPLGIGADTPIKLGPLPVKIGLEMYYYAVRDDDFGPEVGSPNELCGRSVL